jgi:hypothetical protein
LVRIPGIFLQDCFYLLDDLRILLLKDLIRDGGRQHMAGDVPGGRGKGQSAGVRSVRDVISLVWVTVVSYAISCEKGARKKALDNRQ